MSSAARALHPARRPARRAAAAEPAALDARRRSAGRVPRLLARLRALAPRLEAGVADDEERGRFGRARWRLVARTGLLGLPVAPEHGGSGATLRETAVAVEELGRCCSDGGLAFSIATHLVAAEMAIGAFGSAAQKRSFLPDLCRGRSIGAHALTEPGAGSDAFRMRTRACRSARGWVLDGEKCFTTNGPVADVIVVYAVTDRARGTLGGISAFLVRAGTPGLRAARPEEKLGLRTSPLGSLHLEACLVPEDALLGRAGSGFAMFQQVMRWEIVCGFAVTLGAMARQLDACLLALRGGVPGPLARQRLAAMRVRLEVGRLLLARAAERVEAGRGGGREVAAAKLHVSEAYVASSHDACALLGPAGLLPAVGIEVHLRDAVGATIYSGSSEVQRNLLAGMLGL